MKVASKRRGICHYQAVQYALGRHESARQAAKIAVMVMALTESTTNPINMRNYDVLCHASIYI